MRTSLKSALLGAALLTAFGLSAQAQSADTANPSYPGAAGTEQTARLPDAATPFNSPTYVAPNADEESANLQRDLEERDSNDGGDQ
jgi:hypothetical protein